MAGVPLDLSLVLVTACWLGMLPMLPARSAPRADDDPAASKSTSSSSSRPPPRVVLVRWATALVALPILTVGFVWSQMLADSRSLVSPHGGSMNAIFDMCTKIMNLLSTTSSIVSVLLNRAKLQRAACALLRENHILSGIVGFESSRCREIFFFAMMAFLIFYQSAQFMLMSGGPPGGDGQPPGPPQGPPAPADGPQSGPPPPGDAPPEDPPPGPPPPPAAVASFHSRLRRQTGALPGSPPANPAGGPPDNNPAAGPPDSPDDGPPFDPADGPPDNTDDGPPANPAGGPPPNNPAGGPPGNPAGGRRGRGRGRARTALTTRQRPPPSRSIFEDLAINYASLAPRLAEALFVVLSRLGDEDFRMMREAIKSLEDPRRAGDRLLRLRALAAAYPAAVDACGDFTGALGPALVMDTLQARAEILLNLYRFVMSDSTNVFAESETLMRPIMSMAHLVMVSWWATRTASRCRGVLRELVRVDYTQWPAEERDTMEYLTQCADTNEVDFNASGLVPLEMDLVVSVAGWTCSQLVVLKQANS